MSKWVALAAAITLFSGAQAGQHVISGTVRDFDGKPIADADVEMKSPTFEAVYKTKSDAEGRYRMTVEDGRYMALMAVKMADYTKSRLEFWAWNVPVDSDLTIDPRYHRLEIYGINVFTVQGSRPGLMAYFRPMSLTRVHAKKEVYQDPDIGPSEAELDFAMTFDGAPVKIDTVERVKEYIGPGPTMFGYLVHFTPAGSYAQGTHVLRIIGTDKANGDRGESLYFYTAPEYQK